MSFASNPPLIWGSQRDDTDDHDDSDDVNKRIQALTDEAKRHRLRAKKYRERAEKAEAWIEKYEQDSGTERQQPADGRNDDLARERILRAFDRAAIKAGITDLDAAAKLMSDELSELELDDDGRPDAEQIAEVIEQLEERHPAFIPSGADATSPPPARASTSKRQRSGEIDHAYLAAKYPSLARRGIG